jgi:hypothetical protein
MFGLSLFRPSIGSFMVISILILSSVSAILWSLVKERYAKVASLVEKVAIGQADIARWENAWDKSQETLRQLQRQIDSADAVAHQLQRQQAAAIAQRQSESRSAQNRTDSILQILKEDVNARPAAAISPVLDGFDPVVLLGIRRLQCLQSSRIAGKNPGECAHQASLYPDQSSTARAEDGTRRYAPTVRQQLWLLGLVYRFRDWGEACYADKDALAVLQAKLLMSESFFGN